VASEAAAPERREAVALPWLALGATLAIQTPEAMAVYCAPAMAPVAA